MPAPDTYINIKDYATAYVDQLNNTLGRGIVKLAPAQENLIIYFEIANLVDLIRRAGTDAVYLAGVFGIHNDEAGLPEFTISLLGADKNLNILQGHKDGLIDGEEVWPKRKFVSDFSSILT